MSEHDDIARTDDVDGLLGAYVLDAVDDVERRRVERAIASDPSVAREVERLRSGLDALADSFDTEPPSGLWESIGAEISGPRAQGGGSVSSVHPIDATRVRATRPFLLAVASVVAVLVIAGAVVVGLSREQGPSDSVAAMTAMANDAAGRPGSRQGVLTDADRTMEVKVVVDAQGHGFVMTDPLPALPAGETYQLWSAANGTMVSLGMLGSNPQMSLVPIDASVTELALTREPVQGSVSPTSAPMATGTLV